MIIVIVARPYYFDYIEIKTSIVSVMTTTVEL